MSVSEVGGKGACKEETHGQTLPRRGDLFLLEWEEEIKRESILVIHFVGVVPAYVIAKGYPPRGVKKGENHIATNAGGGKGRRRPSFGTRRVSPRSLQNAKRETRMSFTEEEGAH